MVGGLVSGLCSGASATKTCDLRLFARKTLVIFDYEQYKLEYREALTSGEHISLPPFHLDADGQARELRQLWELIVLREKQVFRFPLRFYPPF